MRVWINGRQTQFLDSRDRGLQYGDGVFETMRVCRGELRLLDYHMQRLQTGCERLAIAAPRLSSLRRELEGIAALRREGVLKLIVTRGVGGRGYRPSGLERGTRIISLHPLPAAARSGSAVPVKVRVCATSLGLNPALAGLKTLNRLESVVARAEWSDPRVWEGLMRDADENLVCGTMSNMFLKRGPLLLTPLLDRCGVAGVMRRWVLENAAHLNLRAVQRRLAWRDLITADEMFMSNAIVGLRSVGVVERGRERLRHFGFETANQLRIRLDLL